MARSDEDVVAKLLEIYESSFGGKSSQRYLITWAQIRALYGFAKLHETRFVQLFEAAIEQGLYLFDLGEGDTGRMVAVIKIVTVDRWRAVPKKLLEDFRVIIPLEDEDAEDD